MRRRTTLNTASSAKPPERAAPTAPILVRFEVEWEPLPASLVDALALVHGRVSDLGWRMWDQALGEVGLQAHHAAVLIVIGAEGPLVQARLSDKLMVDKAVMVRLLNELEAMDLVERRPHPSDRRAFEVHMRSEGNRRLRDVERIGLEVTRRFYAPLAEEEQQTLHRLLVRLATSHGSHRGHSA